MNSGQRGNRGHSMHVIKNYVLMALLSSSSWLCLSALGLSLGPEMTAWQTHLNERVYRDFAPYKVLQPDQETVVSGLIADDGKIYNVKILGTGSGDKQFDFDCLQAVMGASSYHPRIEGTNS